jgi:hypothetical protein
MFLSVLEAAKKTLPITHEVKRLRAIRVAVKTDRVHIHIKPYLNLLSFYKDELWYPHGTPYAHMQISDLLLRFNPPPPKTPPLPLFPSTAGIAFL